MRNTRILMVTAAVLAGLALAGCARRPAQTTYYMTDPQTGQQVAVMPPQNPPPGYEAQAQAAPQVYAQAAMQAPPAASDSGRGLAQNNFSLRQTYSAPATQAYAQAPAQPAAQPAADGGRGLFGASRPRAQPAPQYQQPYVIQYGAQPAPQYQPQVGGPYRAAPAPQAASPYGAYASASPYEPAYSLDSGDRLRIVVFGQDGISNSYLVDAAGNVNLPLVGTIPARGTSPQQLATLITARLKQGYVREPHVTVEVEAYRPFFILGEVTNPGQYPYVVNMTAETAIAIAGGFSPRASKGQVTLTRTASGQQFHGDVPLNYRLRPGDTVVVKERWF